MINHSFPCCVGSRLKHTARVSIAFLGYVFYILLVVVGGAIEIRIEFNNFFVEESGGRTYRRLS